VGGPTGSARRVYFVLVPVYRLLYQAGARAAGGGSPDMQLGLGGKADHAAAVVPARDQHRLMGTGSDRVLPPALVILADHIAAVGDPVGEIGMPERNAGVDERDPDPVAAVGRGQPVKSHGPRAP